jgi:hypothetical protein
MRRDSGLPWIILCLLIGLTVGMAVLGFTEAPAPADLAVHNGAGETVTASSFTAIYSSNSPAETIRIEVRPPDQVTEALLRGGPTGTPVRSVTVKGSSSVKKVLNPFSQLLKIAGFSERGSSYVATKPASTLVPADEASDFSGSIHYTATVSNGYLVDLVERYLVITPVGRQSGTYRYQITRIGGWNVPATSAS